MKKTRYYSFIDLTFRRTFIILLIASLYAYAFAYLIPFDHSLAANRNNYINYTLNSINIFDDIKNYLQFFSNEPLFLIINIFLIKFFESKTVVSSIIFFSSFITSFLVLKYNQRHFLILLVILFFPPVFIKFTAHLRQGLAISFFLLGWFSKSKYWQWFFFIVAPLVHSSFFFVLTIYILAQFLYKLKFSISIKIIFTVIIALAIIKSLPFIVEYSYARQIFYQFKATTVSGIGFLIWLFFLLLYIVEGRHFVRKHSFEIMTIVFYLTTYFFIEVSARIFESTILIVLLAGLNLTSWRRYIFYFSFINFFLLYLIKDILV
jgi:hypothetical protein